MKIKAHLLDISKYNQINNYDLLRRYADGIIVRIGYRGYTAGVIKEDAGFREHMQGILNAGIPYGFYFMSQAVTESEAMAEAEFCYEMTKEYRPLYPTYYDSELSNQKGNGRADYLDRRQRTDIALAFMKRLEELGRRAGVYASTSWFSSRLFANELKEYSIWVAQYNSVCRYNQTEYDMWQHTSEYRIPGIASRFDHSYCYRDFKKQEQDPVEPDTIELREGIHAYSIFVDGDKIITRNGRKTNFRLREFRCKDGSDQVFIDSGLVDLLQKVRSHFGKPVSVSSAYRTEQHNHNVGGARSSYHVKGQAADFTVTGVSLRETAKYLQQEGALGIGLYEYTGGFVHVDTRTKKYFWQQDKWDRNYYKVDGFGAVAVYEIKGTLTATVKYNDRNEYVRLLQEELGIKADGIFGSQTEDAVRTFQKIHGLIPDGVAGPKTWNALL